MNELSKTYKGKVAFQTVDFGTPEGQKLTDLYDVSSFPGFILLDASGQQVAFDETALQNKDVTSDDAYKSVYKQYLISGLDKVSK